MTLSTAARVPTLDLLPTLDFLQQLWHSTPFKSRINQKFHHVLRDNDFTGCQRKTSQCVTLRVEQNVHHNPTASQTEALMAADESFSESIPDAVFPRHWWPQAASKSHSFVDNLTEFWWRTSHTWGSELAELAAKLDPPSQNTWASASLAGSCDKTCKKAQSLWLVQYVCFNTDRST